MSRSQTSAVMNLCLSPSPLDASLDSRLRQYAMTSAIDAFRNAVAEAIVEKALALTHVAIEHGARVVVERGDLRPPRRRSGQP